MSEVNSKNQCAICKEQFSGLYMIAGSDYKNLVCRECDERAVTVDGSDPKFGNEYAGRDTVTENSDGEKVIQMAPDVGDNPVYIDGVKCWRLYKFGGWITQRDPFDCDTADEFFSRISEERVTDDH